MPTKDTSVKGIRLPDPMWRDIDRQAEMSEQSRNQWILKRLKWVLRHPSEVGNSHEIVENEDEVDLP